MQNYVQIDNIDHYWLHNIFISKDYNIGLLRYRKSELAAKTQFHGLRASSFKADNSDHLDNIKRILISKKRRSGIVVQN